MSVSIINSPAGVVNKLCQYTGRRSDTWLLRHFHLHRGADDLTKQEGILEKERAHRSGALEFLSCILGLSVQNRW